MMTTQNIYKYYYLCGKHPTYISMKKIILIISLLAVGSAVVADEGMWLPSLIESRIVDMQSKGLKLSTADIYNVNEACLKDAIVQFGGGCTANLVSEKGLIFTNHHCGFSQIQSHSSVEHDYLKNGFWAKNLSEELPNRGLTVRMLLRMEDVTTQVLAGVTDEMDEAVRKKTIDRNRAEIVKENVVERWIRATVDPLYYGNQYFLFVYKVFEDIRLVGAPPSSIGKFGGDTDNWMWPRHTGDFALFRIYADKDNNPAPYSKDNVPYQPKQFLKISTQGIQENDFTFVYGFPARTSQYLFSDAIKYLAERGNPHKIHLRTLRLDIMKKEMAKSPETRIKYAAKQANVANAWKKWQGELKGVIRLNTVEKKKQLEQEFAVWAADKAEYNTLVAQFSKLYAEIDDYAFARDYHLEAFNVNELLRFTANFLPLVEGKIAKPDSVIKRLKSITDNFFKDYEQNIDQQIFAILMTEYVKNTPKGLTSPAVETAYKDYRRDMNKWTEKLYASTLFARRAEVEKLLQQSPDKIIKQLNNDPLFSLYRKSNDFYKEQVEKPYNELNRQIENLYHAYMRGLMAFQTERPFYPDANSTLRIAYGKVSGYKPFDAVYYLPQSTLDGIMQKDNPDVYDYDIPQQLRNVYAAKDYDRWAVDGTVPVAFIANNHTTGGNSGSPVLNSYGHLIGLNFDRTWESTMSDVVYDSEICRNIAVDIRYALFVIDKIANAGYLLNEMVFVE